MLVCERFMQVGRKAQCLSEISLTFSDLFLFCNMSQYVNVAHVNTSFFTKCFLALVCHHCGVLFFVVVVLFLGGFFHFLGDQTT